MIENTNKDKDQFGTLADIPIISSNNNKNEIRKKQKNIKTQKSMKSVFDIANPEDQFDIPPNKRNMIFIIFLLSNLFLNYDTGVIPASLLEIIKEIPLDYKEQALLGSLVYLGLSTASIFTSLIFSKFSPSKVCAFVLILNSASCFTFSLSSNKYVMFPMRFMMGVTEAFIVIYGPVWVNNYSPLEHSAKWMGILHSCTALGVVLGYLVAGIIINFFKGFLSWRFAIQIQGIVEIFFAIFFYLEKDEYINVNIDAEIVNETVNDNKEVSEMGKTKSIVSRKSHIDAPELNNLSLYFYQSKLVLTNPLYLTVTLGLCSIYFIVTGIQFWMTEYMIGILEIQPVIVVIVFSFTSVTAPLSGVIVGGVFADKYGGYKGKNTVKAIKLCVAFGFVSFVFAFPMGFLFDLIYLNVLLWTFLFFGAAIIPVGTGIMISSVRKDCQATSSSLSQLIFNLFGYFFSPMLTGFVMDSFKDRRVGFIWGMRVVFWWVIFALLFLLISWLIAYKKYKSGIDSEEKDLVEDGEMGADMAEIMHLEIRRRLAQQSNI